MKYIQRICFLLLLPVVSDGCGGDSPDNPDPAPPPKTENTITFPDDTPPVPILSGEGGELAIAFTASADWTAEATDRPDAVADDTRAAAEWLSVSPASGGAGAATVRVTATANESAGERRGAVVIRCGKESAEIAISQQPDAAATTEAEIRARLVQLYRNTDGDHWTRNENWCSDKPISEWYGVEYENGELSLDFSGDLIDDKGSGIFSGNNLCGEIDLAGCTALIGLNCVFNKLTGLNVSHCTGIVTLHCVNNRLTNLNVIGCSSLYWLGCAFNELTSLDVMGCDRLYYLGCYDNCLTRLEIANHAELWQMVCDYNRLTKLTISNCPALEAVGCSNNVLTELNISACPKLNFLTCGNNYLEKLQITDFRSLELLDCIDNRLTELDISGCDLLRILNFTNNRMRSFKISGYEKLEDISCHHNDLRTLTINNCPALTRLVCGNNNLNNLNITKEDCPELKYLYCADNRLKQVIPNWFRQLSFFEHDVRYTYTYSQWPDSHWTYIPEDHETGWWYEGEPLQGYHGWPEQNPF